GAGADGVDALKRKASRGHLPLIRMPAPSPRERGEGTSLGLASSPLSDYSAARLIRRAKVAVAL
ncbi:hypothetical protein, partial [Sinorhizobium meliloti]|uniref:hypothetical protein n=1 Tax=Rhizobium meliloti TaxID=382 RepID=UPI001AECE7AB